MNDPLSLPVQMDILADLEIENEILQRGQEEVVVRGRKRFKTRTCAIFFMKCQTLNSKEHFVSQRMPFVI